MEKTLENSALVWHSSLSIGEELEIEGVQRCALRLILGERYSSYEDALDLTNLKTLKERRIELCKNFAKKCVASGKNDIFPSQNVRKTPEIMKSIRLPMLIQLDLQDLLYHTCKDFLTFRISNDLD